MVFDMNRLFIIGLLILISTKTYSQKKYDIEFYGGPLYSYRVYKSLNYVDPNLSPAYRQGKDYFDNVFKLETNQLEKPIILFSAGFKVSRELTNKVNIQLGLEYTSVGEETDYGLSPVYKYVDLGGIQLPTLSGENYHLVMTYRYNYFAVPVSIRYKLCSFKKIEIVTSIGMSVDFLINKKVNNTSEDKEIAVASKFNHSNHEFNNFSSAISVGLELSYSISNKLKFYTSPNLKQYILPNETVMPRLSITGGDTFYFDKINKYNFAIGINTGLRFVGILTN